MEPSRTPEGLPGDAPEPPAFLQIAFIFQGEELDTKQAEQGCERGRRPHPAHLTKPYNALVRLIGRDLAQAGSSRAAPQRPRFTIWH